MSQVADGWEDDEDDGFFVSDDNDDDDTLMQQGDTTDNPLLPRNSGAPMNPPPLFKASPSPQTHHVLPSKPANDGWEDDDDLDFDDDDNEEEDGQLAATAPGAVEPEDQSDTFAMPPLSQPAPSSSSHLLVGQNQYRHLIDDLEKYIVSLDHLTGSINAVLAAEYNDGDDNNNDNEGGGGGISTNRHHGTNKASELVAYYKDRPGLASYTIDKELARMEYAVTTYRHPSPSGSRSSTLLTTTTTRDKHRIARILQDEQHGRHALLVRSANQSVFADLLQACTGPDLLVRPQHMAAAVARTCSFHVDLARGVLTAHAQLSLSVPTASMGRWEVAQMHATVEFVPDHGVGGGDGRTRGPRVWYRLERVEVVSDPQTDPLWHQRLQSAAEVLVESLHHHRHEDRHPEEGLAASHQNFRDTFLQQSQSLLLSSADGMQSAWKEFEVATGIKTKLSSLPGFLPDDVMDAACAAEAEELSLLNDHRRQVERQQQQRPQARPTSILGGLVRSGFKKLAQQVALPTEDPSLYEGWSPPPGAAATATKRSSINEQSTTTTAHNHALRAPQPNHPAEAPLQLYRLEPLDSGGAPRTSPSQRQEQLQSRPSDVPQLYRRDDDDDEAAATATVVRTSSANSSGPSSSSLPPRMTDDIASQAPAKASQPVVVQDGWGDDVDDLDVLEENPDVTNEALSSDRVREPKWGGAPEGSSGILPAVTGVPLATSNSGGAASPGGFTYLVDEHRQVPAGWTYDPETDIVPTRKRWSNPYPNRSIHALRMGERNH
jgi:hypothetical protein